MARETIKHGIDLEQYGVGVPFTLAAVAAASLWRAVPGMTIYGQMTVYGKLGVVVLLIGQALLFLAAGYTYARVDTSKWLKSEEEDKAELLDTDT